MTTLRGREGWKQELDSSGRSWAHASEVTRSECNLKTIIYSYTYLQSWYLRVFLCNPSSYKAESKRGSRALSVSRICMQSALTSGTIICIALHQAYEYYGESSLFGFVCPVSELCECSHHFQGRGSTLCHHDKLLQNHQSAGCIRAAIDEQSTCSFS
jgi:hypothetical protein